jgi:hypothetical protein
VATKRDRAGYRVCEWCGAIFTGRAWGNAYGVFGTEVCAELARRDAEAQAAHQAAVDRAREPDRWRPLREEED